ncbi:hypothetical protein [Rathayibacter iranicus]|nr:hypothetical protein [Rathayibacter iranicus]MWV31023.1 hypothetical protein [Rathayibacter iranicus NCPPB 2253 = VKM Ac-1602]PPI72501.1 hypothetical protein C5E01_04265 [Rathayibacter iranicus]
MSVTHVFTYNGVSRLEVLSGQLAEQVVRRAPMLLDSKGEFAISLSRLPEGKRLRDDLPGSWADLFLQAAGSAAAMMIEVRKQNLDGSESLYRLARLLPEDEQSTGTADITWNGRVDRVPAEEAFDAVEAGDIFWHYYQYDAVPERYELRFLE